MDIENRDVDRADEIENVAFIVCGEGDVLGEVEVVK